MKEKKENVVLFPKWQESLEKNGKKALEEKRYADALVSFDKLISYKEINKEILTGKLICLIELGEVEKAVELCEALISSEDDNYLDYIHIYTTLLFQQNQYEQLLWFLDNIFENKSIPPEIKQQLDQVYERSLDLYEDEKIEKSHQAIRELEQAVFERNTTKQWQVIQRWGDVPLNHHLDTLETFLISEVHPLIKTAILQLMYKQEINQTIKVKKFDRIKEINPSKIEWIYEDKFSEKIFCSLDHIEQENPTFLELIKQLLHRYYYMTFPFLPPEQDYDDVAKALEILGNSYIQLKEPNNNYREEVKRYMDQIMNYEKEYLTIIEE